MRTIKSTPAKSPTDLLMATSSEAAPMRILSSAVKNCVSLDSSTLRLSSIKVSVSSENSEIPSANSSAPSAVFETP